MPEKIVEGPKYVMGIKTNIIGDPMLGSKDVPGPGQYSIPSNAFSTVSYTMRSKDQGSVTVRDGPGPGQY